MLNSDELNDQAAKPGIAPAGSRSGGDSRGDDPTGAWQLATQRSAHPDDVSTCLAMLSDLESEGLSREKAMQYTYVSVCST